MGDHGEKRNEVILTPSEFLVYHEEVFKDGALKYGANEWLKGTNFNKRANEMSMVRHLFKYTLLEEQYDRDSNLFHLQHLGTRALMEVHRLKGKTK